jgi:dihydrofolate synthase/folylpolyglutamate synthase
VPVVLAPLNDQVSRRISQVAEQLNAPLVNVSTTMLPLEIKRSLAGQSFRLCYKPDVEVRTEPRGIHVKSYVQDYGVLRVPLIGDHQINNCATVVATIEAIRSRDITLDNSAIARGIENTHWPGRFQVIDAKPRIILDGAHNPQAAEVLRDTLKQYLPCEQLTFILGILKDKDCAAICQTLAPLAQDIFTVRVKSERASDPESLATLCATANPSANIRALPSFEDAFRQVKNNADATVVVTGSLFLVGEALQRLGLDPRHAHVTQKEMTMQ